MDVDTYIETHQKEWDRLSAACARGGRGIARRQGEEIEEIVRLYVRVCGHLAEVQTRYHDPRLTEYLNQTVARARAAVYAARPSSVRSFVRVFGSRYREAIRRTAPFIFVAAAILIVVAVTTALWVGGSREAQAGVLSPGTRDAIRQAGGSPGLRPSAALGLRILTNNVQVAFFAFALGIAVCVPTIYVVAKNAAMLGVLAGAFGAAGRAGDFWSLVVPHGLLELTAICIAAGAGLRIGWALIDARDRGRGENLRAETRDAVLVVVGVVPAFVIAAAIEGLITPAHVSGWIKIVAGAVVATAYVIFLTGLPASVAPAPKRRSRAGADRAREQTARER